MLEEVVEFHLGHDRAATMVATYTDNLYRHRVLYLDESGIVLNTELKPERYKRNPEVKGLVNTGFLLLDQKALEYADINHNEGWSGLIDPLCEERQLVAFVVPQLAYFNVGTPEEYIEAEEYLSRIK